MKLNKTLGAVALMIGIVGTMTVTASAATAGSSAPAASGAIPTDGTGTVIENNTDTSAQREFFTIKTAAGNVFYIVVDKEKTSDNVYLLTPVTESDLAALAGSKTADAITGGSMVSQPRNDSNVSQAPVTSSQPVVSQSQSASQANKTESTSGAGNTGTIVLVVLAVLIVGGAGFYFKIYRPRHETGGTEDDMEEAEEKSPDTDTETPDEEESGEDYSDGGTDDGNGDE